MSTLRHKRVPITLFVLLQVASVAVLILWIVWWVMDLNSGSVIWLLPGIFLMIWVIAVSSILFAYWGIVRSLDLERVNFLSSVSHELLTPVASMKLYIETMQMRDLTPAQKEEFLREMTSDADRLEELIRHILVACRIERRRENYNFSVEYLSDIIREFCTNNQRLLKGGKLELALDDDCLALVDKENFNMVLSNLLTNAVRYSPEKADIKITLTGDDKQLYLSIADHGQGIEEYQLKKIFKLFYRATKVTGGTGLGLYIVKHVVKAHKGRVWAESPGLGQGTTIKIRIPRAQ